MPIDGERFEIIAMDDLGREIKLPRLGEIPTLKSNRVMVSTLLLAAYGKKFLSKKQFALAMNGKSRVRKKWLNVLYRKRNKDFATRMKSGRLTLWYDETGGDAETAIAVMKCGGAI